jgi:NADH:ubiquinone oxidoreductase subunit C
MTTTRDAVTGTLRDELGERALAFHEKSERRVFIDVAAEDVLPATGLLFERLGARFQTASGVDTPAGFEILYHWAFDRLGLVVSVRTRLPRDEPEIESIANLCGAAEWIEREMWELLGIRFRNHPDLRHLLLSEDWPEGQYPLRRDYER